MVSSYSNRTISYKTMEYDQRLTDVAELIQKATQFVHDTTYYHSKTTMYDSSYDLQGH